jgi:hypothetical protein
MSGRTLFAVPAIVVAIMLATSPVGAQVPVEDSVIGTAALAGGAAFEFNVHSGPSGENPTGSVRLPASDVPARVTCLAVDGSRATVGVDNFDPGLGDAILLVEDNNGAGSDRLAVFSFPDFVTVCPSASDLPEGALRPVATGDIEIVDAHRFPSSKDHCRNGGYAAFGFRNQGECVAFVERGPKR